MAKQKTTKNCNIWSDFRGTPVTSGVPQGFVLGPVLLITFINDIDLGLSNFIRRFEEDTKIGNAVLSEGDRRSLQDLPKISDLSVTWEMHFNISKCQIQQVGSRNIKNNNEMRGIKVKSVHSVKDLRVTVTSNFKFFQQCSESVIRANRRVGLIENFSLNNKDVVPPLYNRFV